MNYIEQESLQSVHSQFFEQMSQHAQSLNNLCCWTIKVRTQNRTLAHLLLDTILLHFFWGSSNAEVRFVYINHCTRCLTISPSSTTFLHITFHVGRRPPVNNLVDTCTIYPHIKCNSAHYYAKRGICTGEWFYDAFLNLLLGNTVYMSTSLILDTL